MDKTLWNIEKSKENITDAYKHLLEVITDDNNDYNDHYNQTLTNVISTLVSLKRKF